MLKSVITNEKRIGALEILAVDSNIMMCTILDLKGRTLSSAESEKWRFSRIPKIEVGERALLSHLVLEGFPREMGKLRFKITFTDVLKLVTMRIGTRIAVFALPKTIDAEPICEDVLRRFGMGTTLSDEFKPEASHELRSECQNCGRRVDEDSDPKASAYLIDVQEDINGELRTIQKNIPIIICTKCKKQFGKPTYLFRGKVKFEDWNAQ